MKPRKEGIEYLTDASVIVMLMSMPLVIADLVRQGNTVYFGFKTEELAPIMYKFEHNEPIPLADAKMVILAQGMFKTIIRRKIEEKEEEDELHRSA
jgi:hypothetical protein